MAKNEPKSEVFSKKLLIIHGGIEGQETTTSKYRIKPWDAHFLGNGKTCVAQN